MQLESVIAFGKIRIMEDEMEIRKVIELLAKKYYPGSSIAEHNIANGWYRYQELADQLIP